MALLSMDTEGSEFEILKNFDFKEFKFDLILVEHNNTFKRELLKELLARNGYARINFSERDIEDWYALV
jgi:hypothetical protein